MTSGWLVAAAMSAVMRRLKVWPVWPQGSTAAVVWLACDSEEASA